VTQGRRLLRAKRRSHRRECPRHAPAHRLRLPKHSSSGASVSPRPGRYEIRRFPAVFPKVIIARNPPRLARIAVRHGSRFSPSCRRGRGPRRMASARTLSAAASYSTGGRRTHWRDQPQTIPPSRNSNRAAKDSHVKTRSAHTDRRVQRCELHPPSANRIHALTTTIPSKRQLSLGTNKVFVGICPTSAFG
jgi:hypothetical protein